MAGRFSVEAIFRAVDRVTSPVKRMSNSVGRFTRRMSRGFTRLNSQVDKFTSGMKRAGVVAAAGLAIMTGAMVNVIGVGAQFEQSLTNAVAKFPGEIRKGTEAFEQLEEAARRMGRTTEFTASQSAQALNFLAMAGFDAEQAVAALPGVVDLATAAQVDLGTATDVATDSLGAFGLATKNAAQLGLNLARINDVIARTTTTANTTVEAMFETIKDSAAVATAAGASLETFSALVGELANAGIKGTRAGTALKNMFLRLASPERGAARLLRKFGVATQDAEGNLRDIVDILGDLGEGLDGLGTAQRSAVLKEIFGLRAVTGANILLQAGSKRLREYRDELKAATGASKTMADVMRDTVLGRFKNLNSAIESVKISIFEMNKGPLADVIDRMTAWVRANEQLIATDLGQFLADVINNIDQIILSIRQFAGFVVLWFALSAAVKVATLAMIFFNGAMVLVGATMKILRGTMIAITFVAGLLSVGLAPIGALLLGIFALNPFGLIFIAVAALVGLAALIITKWGPIKMFFHDLGTSIGGFVFDSVQKLKGAIDKFKGIFGLDNEVKFVFKTPGVVKTIADLGQSANDDNVLQDISPQVVPPEERVARSIEEQRTTSTAEVTIRDETGRAEVTDGTLGTGLSLKKTGSFD